MALGGTILGEVPQEATPYRRDPDAGLMDPGHVYKGADLGFFGSIEAAWDAQVKANSLFSLEVGFANVEAEQNDRIRASGREAPQPLSYGFLQRKQSIYKEYFNVAKYYTDGQLPADDPTTLQAITDRDKQIESLRKAHPDLADLKTYRELWTETQKRAQRSEQVWERSTTTPMGAVGGFLGGAATALNPSVSPITTFTAGWGGFGGSVATRLATQAGTQGAAETINQLSGVQESRRLLGLLYGRQQALAEIGMAAAGGVAFQGVGEVLGAGVRRLATGRWQPAAPLPGAGTAPPVWFKRWFKDRPGVGDPAPPFRSEPRLPRPDAMQLMLPFDIPEAYGKTGVGRLRAAQDLAGVEKQLQDWDGPSPIDARPHSEYPKEFYGPPLTAEEYARQIDPAAFRQWDKLTAEAELLRTNLHQADTSRVETRPQAQAAKTIEDQIATLEERAGGLKNRKQLAKIRGELDELRKQRQALLPEVAMPGVPDTYRARLMRVDEQMRDLAPVISRAQAAARNDWPSISAKAQAGFEAAGAAERALLPSADARQLRFGSLLRRTQTPPPRPDKLPPRGPTVEQHMPMLNRRLEVISKLPHDADGADKLAAVRAEDAKVEATATESFVAKVQQALKPIEELRAAAEPGEDVALFNITGHEIHLDNDFIAHPGGLLEEDGEPVMLSMRQYLKEVQKDQDMLKAVGTCSSG